MQWAPALFCNLQSLHLTFYQNLIGRVQIRVLQTNRRQIPELILFKYLTTSLTILRHQASVLFTS